MAYRETQYYETQYWLFEIKKYMNIFYPGLYDIEGVSPRNARSLTGCRAGRGAQEKAVDHCTKEPSHTCGLQVGGA
jgi:hypothetical protein